MYRDGQANRGVKAQRVELLPAYNRRFNTAAEARKSFQSGQDWVLCDVTTRMVPRYCSIRDFDPSTVLLRWGKDLENLCRANG